MLTAKFDVNGQATLYLKLASYSFHQLAAVLDHTWGGMLTAFLRYVLSYTLFLVWWTVCRVVTDRNEGEYLHLALIDCERRNLFLIVTSCVRSLQLLKCYQTATMYCLSPMTLHSLLPIQTVSKMKAFIWSQHLDQSLLLTLVLLSSLDWALSWEAVIHCFHSMNEVLCWERLPFVPQ